MVQPTTHPVASASTYRTLAHNVRDVILADQLMDGERHVIVMANGHGIEIAPFAFGSFAVFPAEPLEGGYWRTADDIGLGAWFGRTQLEEREENAMNALRLVAMRACRAADRAAA